MLQLKIKKLSPNAILPKKMSEFASGMDLHSLKDYSIKPLINCHYNPLYDKTSVRPIAKIYTGIAMEIPKGYEVQIRPRSSLAKNHGITIVNTPGTIDADYRGEIIVLLVNLGVHQVDINQGDRIAQAVLCPIPDFEILEVEELTSTERGSGGFGSTGR